MREVWFILAIVFSMAAAMSGSGDPVIRWLAVATAILFWVTFGVTERYGRLNRDTTQQKDV